MIHQSGVPAQIHLLRPRHKIVLQDERRSCIPKRMSLVLKKNENDDIRVDRTEVALDASNLFFKYFMPKPRLKLALAQRRCCNAHCLLTSSQQDLLELSSLLNGQRSRRTYGLVGASAALFNGVSVGNVLTTIRSLVSCICVLRYL